MTDTPDNVDLNFIGKRLKELQEGQAGMRRELADSIQSIKDDMTVLAAIVLRLMTAHRRTQEDHQP